MSSIQDRLNAVAGVLHDGAEVGGRTLAETLEAVVAAERELREARTELVCELRNSAGWSWAKVAGALGISKQGALKVYGEAAERHHLRLMRATRDAVQLRRLPAPSSPVAAPAMDVPLELGVPSTLYVVPCGAEKLDHAAPARELYTGEHFRRTLRIVEATAAKVTGARVVIMSAAHGLVDPDTVLAPYNTKLTTDDDTARVAGIVGGQLALMQTAVAYAYVPRRYMLALELAGQHAGTRVVDCYAGARGIGDQRAILTSLERGLSA